jgi:hypothetical protein
MKERELRLLKQMLIKLFSNIQTLDDEFLARQKAEKKAKAARRKR